MFTGIIESVGEITAVFNEGENRIFEVKSDISNELKVDQSLAHDGVCLTVVDFGNQGHKVVAVKETLDRSTLRNWKLGTGVNLERAMKADGRFDGHIVQGHVDDVGSCIAIEEEGGSTRFIFQYNGNHPLVDKGSITVNGISLTVVNPVEHRFEVAIIPYTFENTSFATMAVGDVVNLEFDIVGKYVAKLLVNS